MAKAHSLTTELTLRQVVAAWPSAAGVLERYPNARFDGRWSLQELGPFAVDQRLEPAALLAELSAATGAPIAERRPEKRPDSPMLLVFLALAIGLTLGAGWGASLLLGIALGGDYAAVSPASVHVHGLAQLWGWMALFIFAIGSHQLRQNAPRPAPPWLERIAAGCILAALAAFFLGLWPAVRARWPYLDAAASALLSAAALAFAASVGISLRGRGQAPQRWHLFVLAAIAWLLAWTAADLAARLAFAERDVLPDLYRHRLILLPVLGFATNAIYGFGIRLIPGLLNIGTLRPRAFSVALGLHNLGMILLLMGGRWVALAGALGLFAAALVYLVGMNGLRGRPGRPIHGVDSTGPILIRIAFAWQVVGLGMIVAQQLFPGLPHPFTGAWRHALTVGFITTLILGVGQRLLPVFIRQPLASLRLMRIASILIVVGNAGRVGLELLTIGGWTWAFRLMGLTGLLELTAIGLFALNLAWTVRRRRRVFRRGDRMTADTRIRELINAHPHLQQRLHEIGLTMLDQSPFIAPSLTLGGMALAWGWTPDYLRERLREGVEA